MSELIRIPVDVTNPGQFFACCGLLELAWRKCPQVVGHFKERTFFIEGGGSFSELLCSIIEAQPIPLAPEDAETSPLLLERFSLRLNWWHDDNAGGKAFKTWPTKIRHSASAPGK